MLTRISKLGPGFNFSFFFFFGYVQLSARASDSELTHFPMSVARVISLIAFFDVVKGFHISKSHIIFIFIFAGIVKHVLISRNNENN